MGDSSLMHVVHSIHELIEVGSGDIGTELSSESHKVEQLPSTNILKYNSKARLSISIAFFVRAVGSHSNQVNQVLMIQLFKNGKLMLQSF